MRQITFDQVLPELVRTCRASGAAAQISEWCVARDPSGIVRLVIKPSAGAPLDESATTALADALAANLGKYFSSPILKVGEKGNSGRLAQLVMEQAEEWEPDQLEADAPATERWLKLERRLGKQSWLSSRRKKAPWPLEARLPIVTFFSFKGGVGRTTALASCAWQLAKEGKRVVVLDLDLEAPGLGPLLGAQTPRGVLDFIIDFVATGNQDLTGYHTSASELGMEDGSRVDVFPAGNLDGNYLEKLSRLNFFAMDPWGADDASPVEKALSALLSAIRAKLKPDFILIDSRAGLHDLAGLSLHGLAHVDVIVSRATEQGYRGLEATLDVLGRKKDLEDILCVLVHSMAHPDSSSRIFQEEEAQFRQRAYEAFKRSIYSADDENIPPEDDVVASHRPVVVKHKSGLERFVSIQGVQDDLLGQDYRALWARIQELAAPEEEETEE